MLHRSSGIIGPPPVDCLPHSNVLCRLPPPATTVTCPDGRLVKVAPENGSPAAVACSEIPLAESWLSTVVFAVVLAVSGTSARLSAFQAMQQHADADEACMPNDADRLCR